MDPLALSVDSAILFLFAVSFSPVSFSPVRVSSVQAHDPLHGGSELYLWAFNGDTWNLWQLHITTTPLRAGVLHHVGITFNRANRTEHTKRNIFARSC